MKKCIILCRVSTNSQDLKQQEDALYKEALNQGYDESNIITISDKESAICKDFEEREGITKLIETINKEDVELVIVYEISRIARRADVFYKVRDILIKNKIQLQVVTPGFFLLNEDGSINETSNLLIGLFLSMAENEMIIKKARFSRGKAKAKSEGRFNGGKILFGYKVNSEKKFEIDEVNGEIVKRIFDTYCGGKIAARQIAKQLHDEGILVQNEMRSAQNFIFKLLKNRNYLGNVTYPQLVSKYKFDKAQKLLDDYRKKPRQTYEGNIYFAHKIMFTNDVKSRQFVVKKNNNPIYWEPVTGFAISVNWIDSLLLYCAQFAYIAFGQKDIDRLTKKYRDDIKSIENRLKQYDIDETKIKESIDKLEERYILGKISLDKLESLRKKIEDELKKVSTSRQKDLALVSNYRDNLNAIRTNSDKKIDVYEMAPEEQQNFIWKEIEKVITGRIKNGTYQVSVIYKNPLIKSETYTIFTKRHKIEKDGKEFDLKIVKRYNRKGLEILNLLPSWMMLGK